LADEELSPDEDALDEFDQEDPPGAGKKKIILFAILGLLVLLGGGGAGVYFSGMLDTPVETVETKAPPPPKTVFYELPETLTNLNIGGRNAGVLKARLVLEIIEGTDIAQLDLLQPRIIDVLQVFLRELRIDDLRGSQGLAILRREMLAHINQAVRPIKVSNILFHEILIQ
jgi:flagellar FliL protein